MAHPRAPAAVAGDWRRVPDVWVLGSSDYGARLAAHLGLPYAFAYFFADGQGVEQALHLYRTLYQPSERHPTPQATICVWALAAHSEAEALHHALSRERWRIDRMRGALGALANSLGLDELVINTWAHEPAVRRRSYALLAAQFGLTADPS